MTDNPFNALKHLYHQMDAAYDQTAESYGFLCTGCDDNCCYSLFYHHTHVEQQYLLAGFSELSPARQKDILSRAKEYCSSAFRPENDVQPPKKICPANENDRCLLYTHRPMICRLHGLPHELKVPGRPLIKGRGCAAGRFEQKEYVPFDRTRFYQQMAEIEMVFRQTAQLSGKTKMTIAQILLSADK